MILFSFTLKIPVRKGEFEWVPANELLMYNNSCKYFVASGLVRIAIRILGAFVKRLFSEIYGY